MNRFRQTLGQAYRSTLPPNQRLAEWPPGTVPHLLRLLWNAYDRLVANTLARIDLESSMLQLERSACELLADEMQRLLHEQGGYASYHVATERFEYATLNPRKSNRPPQYDIAFVWRDDATLLWPCEAKVMKREGDVAAYLADVRDAFLTCTYAPFSRSGAMLGLLVKGCPNQALSHIERKLQAQLDLVADHAQRPHRSSRHLRNVPPGKPYPHDFTLHHLILALTPA